MLRKNIRPAVLVFIILTIITGVLYPLIITGITQICFNKQANGNLVYRDDEPVGALLIGQSFTDPKYFWGRPSATSPMPYNASSSSGSNLGPSNPILTDMIKARIEVFRLVDPDNKALIPVDLVTASGSGLDPHISIAGAYYQIPRVARVRGLSQDAVIAIVDKHTYGRFLRIIGEPVVNVLEVNLELDNYKNK
jgi:K+-transporting ATPase ATPase C chain